MEQHACPFQADKPALQIGNLSTEKLKWLVHLRDVGHHDQQRSHAQLTPRTEVKHRACASGNRKAD
jgi:hypothetical protein